MENSLWSFIAPSGVAATQISGMTLHSLLNMGANCVSHLDKDPELKEHLRKVEGLVIDEFTMLHDRAARELIKKLQEHPLDAKLRRPIPVERQIPMFGYRDIILCGDLRQLPPASGEAPFFSTNDFHLLFEFFVLTEDRRHEKYKSIQKLKELIAWGGVPTNIADEQVTSTPIDPELKKFFKQGYLQGWGLA